MENDKLRELFISFIDGFTNGVVMEVVNTICRQIDIRKDLINKKRSAIFMIDNEEERHRQINFCNGESLSLEEMREFVLEIRRRFKGE